MLQTLGVFLQNSKGVTMSTIEVGEHLYTIKLNLTGMTEYGVSFLSLRPGAFLPRQRALGLTPRSRARLLGPS